MSRATSPRHPGRSARHLQPRRGLRRLAARSGGRDRASAMGPGLTARVVPGDDVELVGRADGTGEEMELRPTCRAVECANAGGRFAAADAFEHGENARLEGRLCGVEKPAGAPSPGEDEEETDILIFLRWNGSERSTAAAQGPCLEREGETVGAGGARRPSDRWPGEGWRISDRMALCRLCTSGGSRQEVGRARSRGGRPVCGGGMWFARADPRLLKLSFFQMSVIRHRS